MSPYEPFEGEIARHPGRVDAVVADATASRRGRAQRRGHRPRRPRASPTSAATAPTSTRPTSTGWPPAACSYTDFHVTPLCSPTRAALLTGRNHHAVGHAGAVQLQHRLPPHAGPRSPTTPRRWPRCCATRATRPSPSASGTCARWRTTSAAGPYDQWPLQRGFDRFYGFLDGETDQFHPGAGPRQPRRRAAATPEEGYHLSEDLVDRAIGFLHDTVSIRPDRPFFTLPGVRGHPRAAPGPGRVPGEVPGPLRRGLGRRPRALVRPPAGARGSSRPRPSWPPATPASRPGTTCPRTTGGWPAGCRRPSPPSSTTPTSRSAACSTPSSARPRSTTPSSCCCPTTGPARRAAPSASCTR